MIALALVSAPALAADVDADPDHAVGGAVGGSLAGWGDVPVATDEERVDGTTHLWAQVQVWTTLWDQDVDPQADPATYGDPEADPGFSLNRARIGMDGFVPMKKFPGRSQVDYAIALGIGAPYDVLSETHADVRLIDGFGRWGLPTSVGTTSLAMGLQRIPFGRENGISSSTIPFQEEGVASEWMAPARGVGAVAGQSVDLGSDDHPWSLLARVGAFDPSSDPFGDSGPDLLMDGRLELSVGDTYQTFSHDLENALGVAGAAFVHTEPGTKTTSIEGDVLARYKVITLVGEVFSSTIQPSDTDVHEPGVVAETDRLGWTGMLTGYVPVRKASGLEAAVRLSSFDDSTAQDNSGDVMLLHGGLTWRSLLPRTDVGATYIHRIELANEIPNDTIRLNVQVRPDAKL